MQNITDTLKFENKKLKNRFKSGKVPMETFYEAYFSGELDFGTNIYDFLAQRD